MLPLISQDLILVFSLTILCLIFFFCFRTLGDPLFLDIACARHSSPPAKNLYMWPPAPTPRHLCFSGPVDLDPPPPFLLLPVIETPYFSPVGFEQQTTFGWRTYTEVCIGTSFPCRFMRMYSPLLLYFEEGIFFPSPPLSKPPRSAPSQRGLPHVLLFFSFFLTTQSPPTFVPRTGAPFHFLIQTLFRSFF